jgi:hypothetical protein
MGLVARRFGAGHKSDSTRQASERSPIEVTRKHDKLDPVAACERAILVRGRSLWGSKLPRGELMPDEVFLWDTGDDWRPMVPRVEARDDRKGGGDHGLLMRLRLLTVPCRATVGAHRSWPPRSVSRSPPAPSASYPGRCGPRQRADRGRWRSRSRRT